MNFAQREFPIGEPGGRQKETIEETRTTAAGIRITEPPPLASGTTLFQPARAIG
jgi:hypothetical protein